MKAAHIIAAAMLAAGAVVLTRRSQLAAATDDENLGDEFGVMFNQAAQETAELIDNLTGGSMRISAMAQVTAAQVANKNVQAFLRVIRRGEGTSDQAGYRRIFGGQLFDSFSDHPRIVVRKNGYTSSAAGAYQFLSSTWDETKRVMNLPDFSPASQDLGAVGRIAARGALADVIVGRLETAIKKCAKEWASLPYSPYGQPMISMATAAGVFAQAGGAVTA
jgi:muramidase (phage lysozyme)